MIALFLLKKNHLFSIKIIYFTSVEEQFAFFFKKKKNYCVTVVFSSGISLSRSWISTASLNVNGLFASKILFSSAVEMFRLTPCWSCDWSNTTWATRCFTMTGFANANAKIVAKKNTTANFILLSLFDLRRRTKCSYVNVIYFIHFIWIRLRSICYW